MRIAVLLAVLTLAAITTGVMARHGDRESVDILITGGTVITMRRK